MVPVSLDFSFVIDLSYFLTCVDYMSSSYPTYVIVQYMMKCTDDMSVFYSNIEVCVPTEYLSTLHWFAMIEYCWQKQLVSVQLVVCLSMLCWQQRQYDLEISLLNGSRKVNFMTGGNMLCRIWPPSVLMEDLLMSFIHVLFVLLCILHFHTITTSKFDTSIDLVSDLCHYFQ